MYVKSYSKLEECVVYATPELVKECKLYEGCPRGARAVSGKLEDEDVNLYMRRVLLESGGKVLKGAEENFVCIPSNDYEMLLKLLG